MTPIEFLDRIGAIYTERFIGNRALRSASFDTEDSHHIPPDRDAFTRRTWKARWDGVTYQLTMDVNDRLIQEKEPIEPFIELSWVCFLLLHKRMVTRRVTTQPPSEEGTNNNTVCMYSQIVV